MDVQERFDLVKRNTAETITDGELRDLLQKKKAPRAYIGFAVTGKIHIGYYIPVMKIADFLQAGFHFIVLLADIHAHLDDRKTPFELLDHRVKYYQEAVTAMLKSLRVDTANLKFVKGSDFQLTKEYTMDMYRLAALNTFERCRRAASEVVRFGEHPKLSGFMYPILQALDEQYLDVDVQYGGIDQRKILAFARENLPGLGYRARVEVMTPMLPGLTGAKMSASAKESKIDIAEDRDAVKGKVMSAYCPPAEIKDNGVLAFLKYVVMVYKADRDEPFLVARPAKFGGDAAYRKYEDIEGDYLSGKLHPQDLKLALAEELNALLEPVRKHFKGKENVVKKAFPESG